MKSGFLFYLRHLRHLRFQNEILGSAVADVTESRLTRWHT
jgi:hypothetical protein